MSRNWVIFDAATGVVRLVLKLPNFADPTDQLLSGEDFWLGDFDPAIHELDITGREPVRVDLPPPPPPTAEDIADREERIRLRAHAILNATPDQIDAWIDTNVIDLASNREALKLLAKIAILGVRR